jgi:threonine/homoserine/homoserine lactone efflux protein
VNGVIGDLLPLAVGVAVSPLPIVAVILMLLAPRAGGTSAGFLLGWVLGVAVVTTLFTVLAAIGVLGSNDSGPSTAASWVKIVIGVLLLGLAARQWRGRPRPGEDVVMPKWMAAIGSFTFARATGLGFLLAAVNPKNLLMCVAAGVTVGGSSTSVGQQVVGVAVFTVLAVSTVAVPVIGYAVARERMRSPLDELNTWLQANNATVMAVLLLVIGAALVGKGLGGL